MTSQSRNDKRLKPEHKPIGYQYDRAHNQMVRTGFGLNLMGVIVITAVCYFVLDLKTGLGQ